MVSPLRIYIFTRDNQERRPVDGHLDRDRHVVHQTHDLQTALDWLQTRPDPPDCLVVDEQTWGQPLVSALAAQKLVLPVVVLVNDPANPPDPAAAIGDEGTPFGGAVVCHPWAALPQLKQSIQAAIEAFLRLPSNPQPTAAVDSLSAQQHRLTDKLKARLGYLGVYYKRNPSLFLRHMSPDDRSALLGQLKADYRVIILAYFANDPKINLNQLIDDFVDQAFMADIAVAQIVEIHMDLMEEFSKQLKLEGRSEEILLDYRLTLIDVIAHLCEMYRRSIPRET